MTAARHRRIAASIALIGALGAGAAARAQDPCARPAGERAPDLRCGEPLDGRSPAEPPASLAAARIALTPPRLVAGAVLWPVVKTTDVVEHYRLLGWMEAVLTSDDGLVGVRPVLHYTTSFTSTAGARLFFRRLPGAGSEIGVSFQTAGPDIVIGELGLRGPDRLGLSLSASLNRRNDRVFAGIGPNSLADLTASGRDLARYASDNVSIELRWRRELAALLAVNLHSDVQRRSYRSADVTGPLSVADVYGLPAEECALRGLAAGCVDEAELPGFNRGVRLAHVGGGALLGRRERARDGSGVRLAVDATYAHGLAGDPSRHGALSGETVLALGGSDRVLLFRARAAMVERFGSAPVPFDELVMPSGRAGMRGFFEGRFRGESGLVGTVEYRWYILSSLDATLFVDVGTVGGPRFSNIDWERWFPSFGTGLRYHRRDQIYWESRVLDGVQFAYAPDGGFRVLLALAAF
jgi:hypothetical protein